MFYVDKNQTPVYRDGLTTDRTYAILACKEDEKYNCIVYGRGKLKFYPDATFWKTPREVLDELKLSSPLYNRTTYQGIQCDPEEVLRVLAKVRTQRGVHAVNQKAFLSIGQVDYAGRFSNAPLHPSTHGAPRTTDFNARSTPLAAPEPPMTYADYWPVPTSVKPGTEASTPYVRPPKPAKEAKVDDRQAIKAKEKAKAELLKLKEKEKAAALKAKEKEKLAMLKAKEKEKEQAIKAKEKEKEQAIKAKEKAKEAAAKSRDLAKAKKLADLAKAKAALSAKGRK